MAVPYHIYQRLNERGLSFSMEYLISLAKKCENDTAILLCILDEYRNDSDLDFCQRKESNGNLVILIVRNQDPITIMFRRTEQPFTPEALKVDETMVLTN